MKLNCLIAMIFLFVATPSVYANPSVFVRSDPNGVWWNGKMTARVMGKSAGRVTTDDISKFLEENLVYYRYKVCSLEVVDSGTFVGIDRKTQDQIEEYRHLVNWRAEAISSDGRQIIGQSVLFEGCEPDDPKGGALLVTDASTSEILKWLPMGASTDQNNEEIPFWVVFIDKKSDDELFSFSMCRECGDRTNVYYDSSRKRIYLESNGH